MKNLLIPQIVDIILRERNIGYCGSCMSGCTGMVKFICLGLTNKDIEEWIGTNQELYSKMCDELFEDTPFPSNSQIYSCMFTESDLVNFTTDEKNMLNNYIVGINEQITQQMLGARNLSKEDIKDKLNSIKLDSELYQCLDVTKRAKVYNIVNSWYKKRIESLINSYK